MNQSIMTNLQRNLVARNVEEIARRLSSGLTDTEIMDELKLKPRTYYEYKARVFKAYGEAAKKKTDKTIEFEAELLKDRYIRLLRQLEARIAVPDEPLHDVAYAAEIAAVIATNIFRLEMEGLRARQGRGLKQLEINANRYLGNIQPRESIQDNATTPIPSVDTTATDQQPTTNDSNPTV